MAQPRCYQQITQEERDNIAALYAQRVSFSEITQQVHRNKSTISREISRNEAPIRRVYGACRAQNKAKERKIQAGQRPRLKNALIRTYVKRHLRMEWTRSRSQGDCGSSIHNTVSVLKVFTDSFTIQMFGVKRTLFRCFLDLTGFGIDEGNERLIECRIFLSENRFLSVLKLFGIVNKPDIGKPIPSSLEPVKQHYWRR